MASFGASHTDNKLGLFKGADELFEIFNGNFLTFGNFTDWDGFLITMPG